MSKLRPCRLRTFNICNLWLETVIICLKCISQPDGAMAAAFHGSLIAREFSCFDKKRTSITIVTNVILFSMKLTRNNV